MNTQEKQSTYTLPENWTDLDKLYLCYRVLMHDGHYTREPDETESESAQLIASIFQAVRQALISSPIKSQGDIEIKLAVLEKLVEFEHLDHKGQRDYSTMNPDESAALDILAQMRTAMGKAQGDNQRKQESAQGGNND